MPASIPRSAAWIYNDAAWTRFLADVRSAARDPGVSHPDLLFERRQRQVRQLELDLDDDRIAQLDASGFDWASADPEPETSPLIEAPRAVEPKVDVDQLRQADLDAAVCRIYDGTATVEDIALLRVFNRNPDLDPRDVWIEAGLNHLRTTELTVVSAIAADDHGEFAIHTWARELQRAFALGVADASTAVFPELRPTRVRNYLTNLGRIIEERRHPMARRQRTGNRAAKLLHARTVQWQRRQRVAFQRRDMPSDRRLALEALEVRLNPETAELRWERGFALLTQFVDRHGAIPIRPGQREHLNEWFSLDVEAWLRHQRERAQDGTLAETRIQRIEALGYQLARQVDRDAQWDFKLAAFDNWVATHGTTLVADDHPPHDFKGVAVHLGNWVGEQRQAYKHGTMPAARRQLLEKRGFVWDVLEHQFQEGVRHLRAFVAEFGHANVPQDHVVDSNASAYPLGTWVANRRREWNQNARNLTPARREQLTALGFIVDVHDHHWQRAFRAWRQYVAETGDHACRAAKPVIFEGASINLKSWAGTQRSANNKRTTGQRGALTDARFAQLDHHGFPWTVQPQRPEAAHTETGGVAR